MRGFDTPDILLGKGPEIVAAGFGCVGKYSRSDRFAEGEADYLHDNNLEIFSIWEKGIANQIEYFVPGKGRTDGAAEAAFAYANGRPSGKPGFGCYDFDASVAQIEGPLSEYAIDFQAQLKGYGYKVGAYGNGHLIMHFLNMGYIDFGFLAESSGWLGRAAYLAQTPDIIQYVKTALNFNSDVVVVNNTDVLW